MTSVSSSRAPRTLERKYRQISLCSSQNWKLLSIGNDVSKDIQNEPWGHVLLRGCKRNDNVLTLRLETKGVSQASPCCCKIVTHINASPYSALSLLHPSPAMDLHKRMIFLLSTSHSQASI